MIDIITYVQDSQALIAELQEKFPELVSKPDLDNGDPGGKFLVTKTPTVRNAAGESLSLVRGDDALLDVATQLENLTALGTYEEVFNDPDLLAIYDRVYDRTPKTFTDPETGEQITYTPPDKFGVFA